MLNIAPLPHPKPVKVVKTKKRKRNSPFCHCKKFWINKADYKLCARCSKPLREKDIRKALEIVLDGVVREIVLKRDRFCVCPAPAKGHSDVLQCGHLITRNRESVKWDLWNCSCQCSSCNMRHSTSTGWQYYDGWFIREFGREERLRIESDSRISRKLSVEELETLVRELTAIKARQEVDKDFVPRYSQAQILSGQWRKEHEHTKNPMHEMLSGEGLVDRGAS